MSWKDTAIPADSPSPTSGGWQANAIPADQGPDWGGVVKAALNEARMGNGSKMRALMTDPITQAKVLPYLAGAAGAVTGLPMGATLGTGGGHAVADVALKSYGREDQIPSIGRQALDTGLAAVGDVTAIPAINRKIFGGQVGAVERAAGVPSDENIPSLPKPKAGDPVSGGIDSAIDSVREGLKGGGTPTFWKQIKDQVDSFYDLGKDVKLTQMDKNKLQFLNKAVQQGLNSSVPGRAIPAADLAMSQTVPNAISKVAQGIRRLPLWGQVALGTGIGTGGGLLGALRNVGTNKQ